MSGGSHNYTYRQMEEYYEDAMKDAEMNKIISDLIEVLHDLEWWQSGDNSEDVYRKTLNEFKIKWMRGFNTELLQKIINEEVEKTRVQLQKMIGIVG